MEYGIEKLDKNDIKVYKKVKKLTNKGQYNYIALTKVRGQGYAVKANTRIKKNTLICEYTGDVLTFKEFCLRGIKNDSIMDLTYTPQSETSLIICPYKHSNIARFISGINNFTKFKKQINVFSAKVSINGVLHILLIAKKDIEKNEILYYDYNAGAKRNNYPTKNFIYIEKQNQFN